MRMSAAGAFYKILERHRGADSGRPFELAWMAMILRHILVYSRGIK